MQCSVIVPLYNKSATVTRSLESIRSQTVTDFEVVIVDDGSTDDSANAVQSFLTSTGDQRFRYLYQPNAGPGAARNHGVEVAGSPLVAFLDADDAWLPQHLELTCSFLDDNPSVAAVTSMWFDEPGHRSSTYALSPLLSEGITRIQVDTPAQKLLTLVNLTAPPATVIRRTVFQALGGFREERCLYGEDVFLLLQVVLNHPVAIIAKETALFYRDASELSGNYRTMRPIEPFLEHPELVRRSCPPPLRPLLEQFLAARAFKTAAVLSYWGHPREGRRMRNRFPTQGERWRLPWFFLSWLACSPVGVAIGAFHRRWKGLATRRP